MRVIAFIFEILFELLLLLFYPLFGWVENFLPRRKESIDPHKPTIVLVERWFSTNPLHRRMVSYLEKKGFNVFLHNLPLQKGTFAQSAKELREYIEKRQLTNITLVGISNGGITALLYLQNEDGWRHVRRFISIATPFGGAPFAYFLSPFRSGRELFPGSMLATEIEGMSVQRKEDILSLRAEIDELVPSGSSSLPDGETIVVDVIGHNALHLFSNKTYEQIVAFAKNT